eukprot:SAG22_NODE_1451_length_4395_cov_4.435987_6_plen_97_part_00
MSGGGVPPKPSARPNALLTAFFKPSSPSGAGGGGAGGPAGGGGPARSPGQLRPPAGVSLDVGGQVSHKALPSPCGPTVFLSNAMPIHAVLHNTPAA